MPSIPVPPSLASLSWALASDPVPAVLQPLSSGTGITDKVNLNSTLVEVLCRYAIGGNAVLYGFDFVVDPGTLVVTVNPGLAVIDGIVRRTASFDYTSTPASESTVNIFLKQDATFDHSLDATPPAGKVLYLGQVSTDGTGVVSNTYEGVVYARGGALWRELSSAPGDTLDSGMRLFTQVGTDVYLWDGSDHRLVSLT